MHLIPCWYNLTVCAIKTYVQNPFCFFSFNDLSAYVLKWRLRKCQIELGCYKSWMISHPFYINFTILYLELSLTIYLIQFLVYDTCIFVEPLPYNLLLTFTNVHCSSSLCLLLKSGWVIRPRSPCTLEHR